jgi:flagellar hook-length control protein FliK
LPGVVPAPAGAGLRGPRGASGEQAQPADFASFISLLSGTGLDVSGLPPVPAFGPAPPGNGAKAIGTPDAWGQPPLLRMLVPGGRFSPPGGVSLPPGLPLSAAGVTSASASRAALLATLTESQAALPHAATQAESSEALSPFLATGRNGGALPTTWMRSLLSEDRSTSSDAFFVESRDSVLTGDASLAPAGTARGAATATTVVVPASPAQQPAFEQALGDRLAWLVQEGKHDARIKLHPAELGSIDVRLSVDGDSTRVSLSSPHAAVRDALEQAVPRLRELLGSAGLDLSHVNVGTGDARSHGDFARPTSAAVTGHNVQAHGNELETSALTLAIRLPRGLVDTFA